MKNENIKAALVSFEKLDSIMKKELFPGNSCIIYLCKLETLKQLRDLLETTISIANTIGWSNSTQTYITYLNHVITCIYSYDEVQSRFKNNMKVRNYLGEDFDSLLNFIRKEFPDYFGGRVDITESSLIDFMKYIESKNNYPDSIIPSTLYDGMTIMKNDLEYYRTVLQRIYDKIHLKNESFILYIM